MIVYPLCEYCQCCQTGSLSKWRWKAVLFYILPSVDSPPPPHPPHLWKGVKHYSSIFFLNIFFSVDANTAIWHANHTLHHLGFNQPQEHSLAGISVCCLLFPELAQLCGDPKYKYFRCDGHIVVLLLAIFRRHVRKFMMCTFKLSQRAAFLSSFCWSVSPLPSSNQNVNKIHMNK